MLFSIRDTCAARCSYVKDGLDVSVKGFVGFLVIRVPRCLGRGFHRGSVLEHTGFIRIHTKCTARVVRSTGLGRGRKYAGGILEEGHQRRRRGEFKARRVRKEDYV